MAARHEPRVEAPTTPEEFLAAVARMHTARLRPEIFCEEMPAPQRIAPYASALSADVTVETEEVTDDLGRDGSGAAGGVTHPAQPDPAIIKPTLDTLSQIRLFPYDESLEFENWEKTFAVNVRAPMLTMQEACNHWIDRGSPGAIVNIASVAMNGGIRVLTITRPLTNPQAAPTTMPANAPKMTGPHRPRPRRSSPVATSVCSPNTASTGEPRGRCRVRRKPITSSARCSTTGPGSSPPPPWPR